MLRALALLLLLVPRLASATTVIVGITAMPGDERMLGAAVAGFEAALVKGDDSVRLVLAPCTDTASVVASRELARTIRTKRGCGDADAIVRALDGLAPEELSRTTVAVFASMSYALQPGRHTPEMLARRAQHLGIAVHVVEVVELSPMRMAYFVGRGDRVHWLPLVTSVVVDVERFLAAPSAPPPGPSSAGRQVALFTGGRYEPVYRVKERWFPDRVESPRAKAQVARDKVVLDALAELEKRAHAFAPDQRDGVDELADGSRRPSEVGPERLPLALRGVNLEPLLDAVFDFADARVHLGRMVDTLVRDRIVDPFSAGVALAAATGRPPRRLPSRR